MKLTEYQQAKKMPVTIVLDDVRSALNVGSVFRTSDAFRIEQIILCGITAKPPHKEVLKTAIGATQSVKWVHEENIEHALVKLKENLYKVLAVEQTKGATMLDEFEDSLDQPLAVVFGNEVNGVSDKALAQCMGSLEIPQYGTKHSLNISVSTGIVLWHLNLLHKKSLIK